MPKSTPATSSNSRETNTVLVNLKWRQRVYEDIVFNPGAQFRLFQEKIAKLTTITPLRQRILYKGKVLGDCVDFEKLKLYNNKKGVTFLLLGSTETEIQAQSSRQENNANSTEETDKGVSGSNNSNDGDEDGTRDINGTNFVEDMDHDEKMAYVNEYMSTRGDMSAEKREWCRELINSQQDIPDINYYDFTKDWSIRLFEKDHASGNLETSFLLNRVGQLDTAVKNNDLQQVKRLAIGYYNVYGGPLALSMYSGARTVLHACNHNYIDIVKHFVEEGKIVVGPYTFMRRYNCKQTTPIHIAAFRGHDKLLEFLLSRCNKNHVNEKCNTFSGKTPMELALANKQNECFKLLFQPTISKDCIGEVLDQTLTDDSLFPSFRLVIDHYVGVLTYQDVGGIFDKACINNCYKAMEFMVNDMFIDPKPRFLKCKHAYGATDMYARSIIQFLNSNHSPLYDYTEDEGGGVLKVYPPPSLFRCCLLKLLETKQNNKLHIFIKHCGKGKIKYLTFPSE